ncbi:SAM-dependent methyltransferase [Marinicauda pacifica]|jgi:SAM-dependent methyltransferase|uniref:Class I SAM-dependent methyltransferase n=1 Tax=Marinicauda pacifica TaxID=1133559 RepID=A0A4S2HAV6_9PROT|nr:MULTISPECIES: class I SAM-dependent methyltransferase [Marinicauda]TGY93065.1 class I SAM-dependent methyltransferase [Marinicauda pacifica]GGE42512.1 SAM-dependent methyltransferase [Marinicauda pacifica]
MAHENEILDRIYNLKGGVDECRDTYKDWAKSYDKDTVEGMGYVAPAISADKLKSLVATDTVVLDAGCGTGLAGVELATRGFTTIDGMDLSPDMLDIAREKGAYRELQVEDMTQPLSYKDDAYGAVICVGTFTHSHVGPKGFNELVRITKPGGLIVATVHNDVWPEGYEAHFSALEKDGLVAIREIEETDYHLDKCRLCVLEVK